MSTLNEVLAPFRERADSHQSLDWSALEAALMEREDGMADLLRLAGAQFGVYSEIVSEVLAQIGIGTPLPEDQRQYIRQQFIALMTRLRDEQQGQ